LKKKQKCTDNRCLYLIEDKNQLKKNFSTLTTKTREGKGLWEKCNICGLSINRTGIQKNISKKYYNTSYQKNNSLRSGQILSPKSHFEIRKSGAKKIADKLKHYLNSSMSIYELGAGTGELLFYLRNKVKHCEGNEINKVYSSFIKKDLKINCSDKNFLKENLKVRFDMIISISTIDHIYETRKILEKIYGDLKNGGLFYLELPNDYQILNKYLKPAFSNSFSKFMYQKAHYYSFTFDTIIALLENIGFKIKKKESRKEYTLKNFLNWYFSKKPQSSFDEATSSSKILNNFDDNLEKKINNLFKNFEEQFNKIVNENEAGDTICILAKK